MSTPAAMVIGALLGAGAIGLAILAYEWATSRPRKARQRGNYFRADQPFAIIGKPAAHGPERSDDLIARQARRLMRLRPPQNS